MPPRLPARPGPSLLVALAILAGWPAFAPAAGGPAGTLYAQETLPLDRWMDGALEKTDAALEDGSFYDAWRLPEGLAGVVSITVESPDFDPVVEWVRTGGETPEILSENDDFAGLASATDSRLYVRAGENAGDQLRIYSLYGDAAGSYRVRALPVETRTAGAEDIEYGADIRGRLMESDSLMDGAFMDRYRFRGEEGDVVRIALEADFDTYLFLKVVGSSVPLAEDDDGLGGTDAYLEVELPVSARYEILATSWTAALGEYRLRVGPELDVEPAPDAGAAGPAAGDLPPEMIITQEERDALVVTPEAVSNELMGFSFPSPGSDFVLTAEPAVPQGAPYVHVWTFQDVMETADLVVMAVRPGQEVTAQVLQAFTGGLVQSTGATVVEREEDWEDGQTVYTVLEAPDGSTAELRCSASPGRSGAEDLLVCLIGSSTDGWSFRETLDGLEVR